MRRSKGPLIAVIVIIVILVLVVGGLLLYKFVFNKDNKKPNNPTTVEQPPVEEEPTVNVGDYIEYTPDKASNYVVSGTNSGVANNSTDGIKQEDLEWRVLNVNEDGTIDIISEYKGY